MKNVNLYKRNVIKGNLSLGDEVGNGIVPRVSLSTVYIYYYTSCKARRFSFVLLLGLISLNYQNTRLGIHIFIFGARLFFILGTDSIKVVLFIIQLF